MKKVFASLLIITFLGAVAAYAAEVNCALPSKMKTSGDVYLDNLCAP